jgi:hypothetical protein
MLTAPWIAADSEQHRLLPSAEDSRYEPDANGFQMVRLSNDLNQPNLKLDEISKACYESQSRVLYC